MDTTNISYDRGIRTAAAVAEISQDGKLEMIVGNYSGGLEYFNGNADVSPGISSHLVKHKMLHIYPNPAKDEVYIQTGLENESITEVEVLDINGRMIFQDKNPIDTGGFYMLDLRNFRDGIYLVKAMSANKYYTGRMIKTYSSQ